MRKGLLLLCPLLIAATVATSFAAIRGAATIQDVQRKSPGGDVGGWAPPDTVGPVEGVITAFDTFPTGFAIYIQDPAGGPWSGIDVFTGGNNTVATLGLAVGDRISVEGQLDEFSVFTSSSCYGGTANGETEIRAKGPSAFGTDLIITKISSGNPIAPFKVGTVAELKETCTNAPAEQWEGVLVQVNGPMRIVRTNFTGGLGTFRASLVVDNVVCPPGSPAPCDSFFIDLSTLSFNAVDPGVVDQLVDFVRGVYNQRSRGFRVQVRNGNDYGLQAAPKLVRAFPIGNDKIRTIYDRDALILTGGPTTTFELASFGNVDVVTQVDGVTIDLDVSSTGLSAGDLETVTVTNIASASNPLLIETTAQPGSFRYGIVSPAQIQTADTDSLTLACHDVSQYLAAQLNTTFRGVCTAAIPGNLYYVQGSTGPRDAVALFAPPSALTVGNQYVITASVTQERFDETQMSGIVYVADEGPVTPPAPIVLPISDMISVEPCTPAFTGGDEVAGAPFYAEDYECMLVRAEQVKVVTPTGTAPPGGFFDVAGPFFSYTDSINVDDDAPRTYEPVAGNLLDVTGVLHFSFGEFRIQPRGQSDIEVVALDVPGGTPRAVSLAIGANPSRTPRVEYALPRAADVDLSVYDVSGRKLQTLVRGNVAAGNYSEVWNGRDARGNAVGAGVYFYRLRVDGAAYEARGVKLN